MSEATFSEKNQLSREDIAELTELMCLERSEVSESGTGLLELIAEQEQILEDLGIESKELLCSQHTGMYENLSQPYSTDLEVL
ncbi:hypothetical protein C1A_72 [Wolbachia endosymbiont of Culex quinquefasciatus JHB]|uniref:Uncharacterized protein n=2 Tax=unclassified Wolbachia TaxID=2640676 RepID=A0AAU8MKE7_9RICK|nr:MULTISPECIES: hypothetical protein [Wolbachia]EEB55482.1 hypothetical protein C1A_72 [Wolbachia endosymbiont of Culex quinquefasciatus JHB]MBS9531237.1 hypothetical protein [Wolbachia endosymbiont of Rhagoletis cerasi]PBQ26887.1 hypothetical protein BTO27_04090 [Wolbachia pipientis wAus]QEK90133.1 hypothetical protein CAI20_05845 [Wolbachia endosymbiont of Chrysomya megacephala]UFO00830.1 hypothetical protein LOK48_02515 [Wolbachia endosymbiont of Corcyra cephalonica]